MNLLNFIFKRAKRKRRNRYIREWQRGQHTTACDVCLELKKLHLPLTSHVEPSQDVYQSPDAKGYIAQGRQRRARKHPGAE